MSPPKVSERAKEKEVKKIAAAKEWEGTPVGELRSRRKRAWKKLRR